MTRKKRTFESFEDWKALDVKQRLQIKQVENLPILVDWTSVSGEIADEWQLFIEKLRLSLINFYAAWKEEDLKMNFIAPLLVTIPFVGENHNHFAHSWLSSKIGKYPVKGFVDWMVATGLAMPEEPFFFLHEYKQLGGNDPDPEGQVLIAMLAAQQENKEPRPIYGCYVLGKWWQFIILDGATYSTSQGFDATNPAELTKIWLILKKTSDMVEEWAKDRPID